MPEAAAFAFNETFLPASQAHTPATAEAQVQSGWPQMPGLLSICACEGVGQWAGEEEPWEVGGLRPAA